MHPLDLAAFASPPSAAATPPELRLASGRQPLLWQTAAPAEALPGWRCEHFGPALAGSAPGALPLGLLGAPGGLREVAPAGLRWTLIRPPSPAAEPPPDAPEAAAALAAAGEGCALLVDWQTGQLGVFAGAAGHRPAFLLRTAGGGLRLVEGVSALRARAASHPPLSLAMTHLLGFGHVPPGGALLEGVWPLLPGEHRLLGWDEAGPFAPGPLTLEQRTLGPPGPAPAGSLADRLTAQLGPLVAGRGVLVVATRPGPATTLLEAAAAAAGAARVTRVGAAALPASLAPLQSAATVLTGQPQADPALLADAAAAMAGAAEADLVLLDWGSDALLPARAEYRRFADLLARTDREAAPLRSVASGFLRSGRFARDLLFDEIALFSDDERFRLLGPALLGDGFLALADEFGLALETVAPEGAAALAARLDPAFRPGAAAPALRAALRAITGRAVLTPFLAPGLAAWPAAAPGPLVASAPGLRPADLAADRLGTILGQGAAVFASGLLTRTPPMLTLMTQGEGGSARQRRQGFGVLALEKWLRALGAGG